MKTKPFITIFLTIFLASCVPMIKPVVTTAVPTNTNAEAEFSYPPCTALTKTISTPFSASDYTSLDLSNDLTLIEYQGNQFPLLDSGCFYNYRDRANTTEIILDNSYQVKITSIDTQNELVAVLKDGKMVYEINIHTSTYSGLMEAWGYQDHWVIEVVTANGIDIIRDGESLKTKNNYKKVFAFQILDKKPFYFFEKSSYGFGVNYNDNEIPLEYEDIPYLNPDPGSGGTITQFQNMVSFYGVKNGIWQQALIGSFK